MNNQTSLTNNHNDVTEEPTVLFDDKAQNLKEEKIYFKKLADGVVIEGTSEEIFKNSNKESQPIYEIEQRYLSKSLIYLANEKQLLERLKNASEFYLGQMTMKSVLAKQKEIDAKYCRKCPIRVEGLPRDSYCNNECMVGEYLQGLGVQYGEHVKNKQRKKTRMQFLEMYEDKVYETVESMGGDYFESKLEIRDFIREHKEPVTTLIKILADIEKVKLKKLANEKKKRERSIKKEKQDELIKKANERKKEQKERMLKEVQDEIKKDSDEKEIKPKQQEEPKDSWLQEMLSDAEKLGV